MKIATSYFYQIRNFKPNMIPVSTCMSDLKWYRPPQDKEYYIDKRGIVYKDKEREGKPERSLGRKNKKYS